MDRATKLLRRTWILTGVVACLLAVVLLRSATTAESLSNEKLPATFPVIDVAKITAVDIERAVTRDGKPATDQVKLERVGQAATWVVASAFGYPADPKKVEDFLRTLGGVRTKSVSTTESQSFSKFAGADGWTDVRLYADGRTPVVSFGIGKGSAEGVWNQLFVRLDDLTSARPTPGVVAAAGSAKPTAGKVVVVTGLEAGGNRAEATSWIDTRLWPGLSEGEIVSLSIDHAPKSFSTTLVLAAKPASKDTEPAAMDSGMAGDKKDEKAKDAEPAPTWTMTKPEEAKASDAMAKQLCQAFAGMLFSTIEDGKSGSEVDAKYGFDKPDLVIVAKGRPVKPEDPAPTWKLEVGKKVEGKPTWYVRRSSRKETFTFTVNDFDLVRFRDDPKEFLEKKPEPPAPPPAPPAGGEPAMSDSPGMGAEPPAMGADGPAMTDEPAMAPPPPPAPPEVPEGPKAPGMSEDGAK